MRSQRLSQWLMLLGCVAWGIAMTGCAQTYAQRSPSEWVAARALPGMNPDQDVARVKRAGREDIYTLVRELNDRTQRIDQEIGTFYVPADGPLGFERGPEGAVFAVAADHRELLQVEPGVTHVWYRENMGWAENSTGLLILGGIALVAGIVVLAASGDGTLEINF
ncbi:MAG: hypothetical protein AAF593_15785 [Planctomycetota bacterium]